MNLPDWMIDLIRTQYNMLKYGDYPQFVGTLKSMRDDDQFDEQTYDELLLAYPNPRPISPPDWSDEDGAQAYLKNPPDGPRLATRGFHKENGWMTEEYADSIRLSKERLRALLGFDDAEVMTDIQENALRTLDVCNDPREEGRDWGANRKGLVYGMVQSGKTASMLSLISLGIRAGYRLFILLSGDKSSLRDQTQLRVNKAFGLTNGIFVDQENKEVSKHSPTYHSDFNNIVGGDYTTNFLYDQRLYRGEDWATIIVIKKETHHLNGLIEQLVNFKRTMREEGNDTPMGELFPTMIIDDEADYASLNIGGEDAESTIYGDIKTLRNSIDRNCYIAYTATPQACLQAALDDPVGYPRDFWWMIEPFYELDDNGERVNRTYLGIWEVFMRYDPYLLHRITPDEWPHHEKGSDGKSKGVRVPAGRGGKPPSRLTSGIMDVEEDFLAGILEGKRDSPEVIYRALMDYMITCGVRWWRNWNKTRAQEKPSTQAIARSPDYKFHSMMVHLSLKQDNQRMIREVVSSIWDDAKAAFASYDPDTSPEDHSFRERWRLQTERTRYLLRGSPSLPYSEIAYFIERCIEITEEPIYNPETSPTFTTYPGEPWIYLLNSSEDKMELNYNPIPKETRTKKAAIVVGGNILSRGLTIEGLSVSVFGRTAALEKHDTVLQRGRWFGHKMNQIDITAIHLQEGPHEVFRQIAEADRYLRLQLKLALHKFHKPDEVLVHLRNSPWVSPTSKSGKKRKKRGMGLSGKSPSLTQPSFKTDHIVHNDKELEKLRAKTVRDEEHGVRIARDFGAEETIKLLRKLKCPKANPRVSFSLLAEYLDDWSKNHLKGASPPVPPINIVINKPGQRQRILRTTSRPRSVKQAVEEVTTEFSTLPRGRDKKGVFRGDAFLDKNLEWHRKNKDSGKKREIGDDILIVLYPLDPNYIRRTWYDMSKSSDERPYGKRVSKEIRVPKKHALYVPGDVDVIAYAAWIPKGGPMYDVWTNSLIDPAKVKQDGLEVLE